MESFQRDFLDVIRNNYANFYGRVGRRDFWMFVLWQILVGIGLLIVAGLFWQINETLGILILVVLFIFYLAIIVPSLCLTIRRLHDIGQTGWLLLLYIFGLGIVIVILNVLDSQPGPNKYGPNPKEEGQAT
jgi:uncharacterized membrane protein YhaH (DUF805 family)